MPTSFGVGPAALRSALAILPTFSLMSPTAPATQSTALGAAAHFVTSLPPIETVISAIFFLCARMYFVAALSCVVPPYFTPPGPRPLPHSVLRSTSETVVSPPQPKLTSLSL